MKKLKILLVLFFSFYACKVNASTLEEILVYGNKRVSDDTIKMFSQLKVGQNINEIDLNNVLKDLYNSNFFKMYQLKLLTRKLLLKLKNHILLRILVMKELKLKKLEKK